MAAAWQKFNCLQDDNKITNVMQARPIFVVETSFTYLSKENFLRILKIYNVSRVKIESNS